MDRKMLWFGTASCSLTLLLLLVAPAIAAENLTKPNQGMDQQQSGDQSQQTLAGMLQNVTDGKISLKTSDGQTKEYDISKEKKGQIQGMGLKTGDSVIVKLDQKNQIVDVSKLGGG